MNFRKSRNTSTNLIVNAPIRLPLAFGLTIALLTIAPAVGAATPFGPEQIISSATDGAQSVFAIDIDGDGDTDAVSAALQGDEVAWYENDTADGSSWVKRVIATVDNARAVHAVDIDGDGDADVFSAAGNVIRWHKNDGASPPAWSSHPISSSVFSASDVWAGDIDGDGDIDAISSSLTTDNIYWHENTAGDGSAWSSHLVTNSLDFPQALDGADVDGDGDIDILAVAGGNTQNKISWFENGNSWSEHSIFLVPPIYFPGLLSVHAVDIDSDGDIDVLASGYTPVNYGWIMLWTNTATAGNPPFWRRSVIDTNPGDAVIAADLDGDGDPDIIKTSRFSNDVSWYENPTWKKTTIGTASGGRDVFAADVDGDSDYDILAASSNDDTVAWYENAPPIPLTYTIGGSVSGLTGTGLVLQNNGGDDLSIPADGVFTFATALDDLSNYTVTVLSQPVSPNQVCRIVNGIGVLAGANISNVAVNCQDDLLFKDSFEDIE